MKKKKKKPKKEDDGEGAGDAADDGGLGMSTNMRITYAPSLLTYMRQQTSA